MANSRSFLVTAVLRLRDEASQGLSRVDKGFRGLGDFLSKRFVITLSDVARALRIAGRAIQESITLEGQERALQNQLNAIGVSFDEYISKLEEVARGTVATADLIGASSRALLLGIPAGEITDLLEIARRTSEATGQSVTDAFDDITLAIARGSSKILDNLGIQLKLNEAYERYAESIDKTVDSLTNAEKGQAFLFAAQQKGLEITEELGREQNTLRERILQAQAAFKNARLELGRVIGAFAAGLISAGDLSSKVNDLAGTFNQLARFAEKAAQALAVWARIVAFPFEKTGTAIGFIVGKIEQWTASTDDIIDWEGAAKRAGVTIDELKGTIAASVAETRRLNANTRELAKAEAEAAKAAEEGNTARQRSIRIEKELASLRKEGAKVLEELGLRSQNEINEALQKNAENLEKINRLQNARILSDEQAAFAVRKLTAEREALTAVLRGEVATVEEYEARVRATIGTQNEWSDSVDLSTDRIDLNTRALIENQNAQDRLNQSKRDDPDRDPLIQSRNTVGGGTFTVVRPRDQGPRIGSPLGGWVVPGRDELFR